MPEKIPEKLSFVLLTPEKRVDERQIDEVIAPGIEGEFGVLPGHVPFITLLKVGEVELRDKSDVERVAISWGYSEVLPDRVTILAETAELARQIDVERAIRAKERAEDKLRAISPEDKEYAFYLAALERAINRIQVAGKGELRIRT